MQPYEDEETDILYNSFFSFTDVMGQNLEFSGGINYNRFFSTEKDGGHLRTKHYDDYGYSIGIGIEDIKLDSLLFRFTLKLDNYKGKFHLINGGLGGESTTDAFVDKYTISLGIYPLNFKIFKNLKISFGGELNYLIKESETGYKSSWQMGQPDTYILLKDGTIEKNNKFNFGLICRIGYNIQLKNNWFIVPQYVFYRGLTEEFKDIEVQTKSLRHYFEIGIIRHLK